VPSEVRNRLAAL